MAECPLCGMESSLVLIDSAGDILLTECKKCGWYTAEMTARTRYLDKRKLSAADVKKIVAYIKKNEGEDPAHLTAKIITNIIGKKK